MMTGKRFKGPEAEKWHLVNRSVPEEKLEETLQGYIKQLLTSAPEAVKVTKNMIGEVIASDDFDETINSMAHLIATLRASDEGQEGMSAFLEKRKAKWVK
jgi:methylglutaconyl-CoA hydratase